MKRKRPSRELTNMQWAILLTVRQDDLGYYERYKFTGSERTCALTLHRQGLLKALDSESRHFCLTARGLKLWKAASSR